MIALLFGDIRKDFSANFSALLELRVKIKKWWTINTDIPTCADLDDKEVKEENLVTQSKWLLILGDKEASNSHHKEFTKQRPKT